MHFTNQEKLTISAVLLLLYLIPAGIEWLQFGAFDPALIALSMPIWLLFFYLGPFWLYYVLQKFPFMRARHIVLHAVCYVALMFAGAHMVSRLHSLAFPQYQFGVHEQFLSAFLWGVFIFVMVHMYLLYQRFVEEKRLRQEAQLADLTSRLNPHFLFNSLNTISALIHTAPASADNVLHKLADILRYSVDQQNEWVCLEQELKICQSYLSIEKTRFTENLVIHYQVDEALDLTQYKVPPLLLQPLIENAVKHVKRRPIQLAIGLTNEQGHLVFTVGDNGDGFTEQVLNEQVQTGQGLAIVKKRVAIAGGSLQLSNHSADQGGAVCSISLPIQLCAF